MAADMVRQASQIKNEGKIIKALENLSVSREGIRVRIPALIDQSLPKAEYTTDVFICVEPAEGIDLRSLARNARFGPPVNGPDSPPAYSVEQNLLLANVRFSQSIPETILLRAFAGLLDLLGKLHSHDFILDSRPYTGIIWNDVKPEHLFWEASTSTLTVIDWGNAQVLEEGISLDRQFSSLSDLNQFVQEIGRFLEEYAPDLYKRLRWGAVQQHRVTQVEDLDALRGRINKALSAGLETVRQVRRQEADLAFLSSSGMSALDELNRIQSSLLSLGEYPDPQSIGLLQNRLTIQLAGEGKLEELLQVCQSARETSRNGSDGSDSYWKLVETIASLTLNAEPENQEIFRLSLKAGVNGDWPAALWGLLQTIRSGPIPAWWEDISRLIRQVHLGVDDKAVMPYTAVSRAYYTLQAIAMQKRHPVTSPPPHSQPQTPAKLYDALLRALEVEVLTKWKDPEPDPPFSGIEYGDIESLYTEMDNSIPTMRSPIEQALEQAKSQSSLVMDAWRRKDFDAARRALRLLLLWDPHRRRVLQAEHACITAPKWLGKVRSGVRKGDELIDFITDVELAGRELRNQVGSAPWLESLLEAFKQLRGQVRPADLMMAQPELLMSIPWLNEYSAQETIHLPASRPLSIDRGPSTPLSLPVLVGTRQSRLGKDGEILLGDPSDTWTPEAVGSSARVFDAVINNGSSPGTPCVLKILRADKLEYALPLFQEEAKILTILRDVPGVNRLLECGFLKITGQAGLPAEGLHKDAGQVRGNLQRYGINEVQNFLSTIENMSAQGWIPYIALEKLNQQHNLMVFCDAGRTHGRFLPLRESLLLSIQICDILQMAHDRNIAYRDHKILHYYWDAGSQAVVSIDWNIARRYPQGLPQADRQFDIVQFGARALHHILTGRSAPGSLPLGGNLLQEVEQAAHSYITQWTYDDERLPQPVKDLLARVLAGAYDTVRDLRQDLFGVYQQLTVQNGSTAFGAVNGTSNV